MNNLQKSIAILALAVAAITIYWVLASVESVPAPEPNRSPVEQPTFPETVFESIRPGGFKIEVTDFGPIFIIKPSEAIWGGLERTAPRTKNPSYETYNSELDVVVVWGVYDFDGPKCLLQIFPKGYDDSLEQWEGGFYDSCRDLYFDFSGRVLDLSLDRAEPNLRMPRYEAVGNGLLRVLEPDPFEQFRQ